MGRLAKHAHFAVVEQVLQRLIAACSVRVERVARLIIALLHGGPDLLVLVGGTADILGDGLVVAVMKVVDARKVRRVAHVHCVGQRLNACLRLVFTGLKVVVEDVVGIVGGNEALHGKPHLAAEEGRADVAEIARGHAHHQVVGQSQGLHAGIGVEIIERLGQEAGHVDGVGRSQLHVVVQLLVHEGTLHQRLAIVEHAVHLDGGDVLAECGELALLNGRHLSLGIEHIHVDALHAQESVGNGRTRVAAGGHQHVHLFRLALFLDEIL